VYLREARALRGPFVIDRVYSDGRYRLIENGKLYMDNVREKDLLLSEDKGLGPSTSAKPLYKEEPQESLLSPGDDSLLEGKSPPPVSAA